MSALQIDWQHFAAMDMRAGTVVNAEPFAEAKKPAYKLKIDFGEIGILQSSAQITGAYTCEQLIGMQVIAVVNFPPKQIANFMSQCLVLGVYEGKSVILLQPNKPVSNGSKVG